MHWDKVAMTTKLFSADGIRGNIGQFPLRREDVERLGRVLAAWLRSLEPTPTFLIASDTRESSHSLKAALVDGLNRGGIRVVDSGILPTAAVSYLILRKGYFAGGAMVSASHNPVVENGIKIFDCRGTKINDGVESFIEDHFGGNSPLPIELRPATTVSQPELADSYVSGLVREMAPRLRFKSRVVMDYAHGAASGIGPSIMAKLDIPHVTINTSPNGININKNAGSEFIRFNPKVLARELRYGSTDLGVALDGDADRAVFVDSEGRVYDGDMVLAMLSLKFHAERRLQQDAVVVTPMSNSALAHYLHQRGIATRVVQNGDKYITHTLVEEHLSLGGEEIGHVIAHTDDLHVTGDGLRTALLLLTLLSDSPDVALRDLAPGMRKWPQVKASAWIGRNARLPSADEIPGLPALLHQTRGVIPDLTHLECRPASTEPVYRIMLEASTTATAVLGQHARRIGEYIQQYLGRSGFPIFILDCVMGGCIC